jgi:hypothetical protein
MPGKKAQLAENYGKLPLGFEARSGEGSGSAQFLARGSGYSIDLAGHQAELSLCGPARGGARSVTQGKPLRAPVPGLCDTLRMQLEGASAKALPAGEERLPGTANYFIGNDPSQWRTGIPTYARVRFAGIYPGIDLVYYGNQRQLEYDFVSEAGADPAAIRLRFGGARQLRRETNGDLVVKTAHGWLRFQKPSIYQLVNGARSPVEGDFDLAGKHTVRFRLGSYDRSRALVIDPVLIYSTFLGGSGADSAKAIALDSSGDAYVVGQTNSPDFPTTHGSFQVSNHGATSHVFNAFVTKMNPTGTALIYSTYLGGSGGAPPNVVGDVANAITVDSVGDAYVTGQTGSTNFPVTGGVVQIYDKAAANGDVTAVVTKLNPDGTALVYSTYLGGSGTVANAPFAGDTGTAIAVDSNGAAYVAGWSYSSDFPVTSGALQKINNSLVTGGDNGFVAKLNPTGAGIVYATYIGGGGTSGSIPFAGDSCNAIAVDGAGDAYIAGQMLSKDFLVTTGAFQTKQASSGEDGANAFVAELNPAGTTFNYSTYLGGNVIDTANAIAIDPAGDAYVTGYTFSNNFPVTAGAIQPTNNGYTNHVTNAYVSELNPAGSALVYSTYLGGSGGTINLSPGNSFPSGDEANGLAIDRSGDAYVAGSAASADFPVTTSAYQPGNHNQSPGCAGGCYGGYNAFVAKIGPNGTNLAYSTFLGGNGFNANNPAFKEDEEGDLANGLALDSSDNAYITGDAESGNFPITPGVFQTTIHATGNAFIAELNLSAPPGPPEPTVTVTPTPGTIGSAQTLLVTVAVVPGTGSPTPTGSITLTAGSYISPATVLSGGSATFTVPSESLPSWPANQILPDFLTANYLPDAASSTIYSPSSGTNSVDVVAPVIAVTPSSPTITWAQAQSQPLQVTIAASVAPTGLPLPTGTVTLSTGSFNSAAASLSGGSATVSIPAGTLATGVNNLTAKYSGDTNYEPDTGAGQVTVGPVTVTVLVQPSLTTITTSEALPVTIVVTPGIGAGAAEPTGTVTLTSGTYSSGATTLSGGSASITIPPGSLSAGTDTLTGDYSGDANYPSIDGTATVIVTAPTTPSFTVSGSAVSVTPGATTANTSTITVTPSGGFTGNVALTAVITSAPKGAQLRPTLSFGATSPADVTGASAGTATLTISTTAPGTSPCAAVHSVENQNPWRAAGGVALACLLLFGFRSRRRRLQNWLGMMALLVFLAGGLSACGDATLKCLLPALTGTTPGSYTITVTGTSGTTSATGTVNLTVE